MLYAVNWCFYYVLRTQNLVSVYSDEFGSSLHVVLLTRHSASLQSVRWLHLWPLPGNNFFFGSVKKISSPFAKKSRLASKLTRNVWEAKKTKKKKERRTFWSTMLALNKGQVTVQTLPKTNFRRTSSQNLRLTSSTRIVKRKCTLLVADRVAVKHSIESTDTCISIRFFQRIGADNDEFGTCTRNHSTLCLRSERRHC